MRLFFINTVFVVALALGLPPVSLSGAPCGCSSGTPSVVYSSPTYSAPTYSVPTVPTATMVPETQIVGPMPQMVSTLGSPPISSYTTERIVTTVSEPAPIVERIIRVEPTSTVTYSSPLEPVSTQSLPSPPPAPFLSGTPLVPLHLGSSADQSEVVVSEKKPEQPASEDSASASLLKEAASLDRQKETSVKSVYDDLANRKEATVLKLPTPIPFEDPKEDNPIQAKSDRMTDDAKSSVPAPFKPLGASFRPAIPSTAPETDMDPIPIADRGARVNDTPALKSPNRSTVLGQDNSNPMSALRDILNQPAPLPQGPADLTSIPSKLIEEPPVPADVTTPDVVNPSPSPVPFPKPDPRPTPTQAKKDKWFTGILLITTIGSLAMLLYSVLIAWEYYHRWVQLSTTQNNRFLLPSDTISSNYDLTGTEDLSSYHGMGDGFGVVNRLSPEVEVPPRYY